MHIMPLLAPGPREREHRPLFGRSEVASPAWKGTSLPQALLNPKKGYMVTEHKNTQGAIFLATMILVVDVFMAIWSASCSE
jgi:hypothetical protein